MKLEVMSWNIWMGKNFAEVEAFLQAQKPDIVGLQEVKGAAFNGNWNQAQELAQSLGYNHAYYSAYTDNEGPEVFDQGNAVLSKYPIISSAPVFLSSPDLYQQTPETEPRIAVTATIDTPKGPLTFITAHLAYSHRFQDSKMRDLQFANLMELVAKSGRSIILTGDFNSPSGELIQKFSGQLTNVDPMPDQPTWSVFPTEFNGFKVSGLEYRLDQIFASDDMQINDFQIPYTEASDHLPVIASLEV